MSIDGYSLMSLISFIKIHQIILDILVEYFLLTFCIFSNMWSMISCVKHNNICSILKLILPIVSNKNCTDSPGNVSKYIIISSTLVPRLYWFCIYFWTIKPLHMLIIFGQSIWSWAAKFNIAPSLLEFWNYTTFSKPHVLVPIYLYCSGIYM